MESHIKKWGNSFGIRIPKKLARSLHLSPGSPVNLEIEEGRLIIEIPQYNLETMLQSITNENQHHLLLEDSQAGEEEW